MELFVFEIWDYLPKTIQSLFFNSQTEQIQDSAVTIANISSEKQSLFFNEIVNVLIGKNDITAFEKILIEKFGLTPNMATAVIKFLNEKLFDSVKNDLKIAQSIYKEMSTNPGNVISVQKPTEEKEPTEILSYIKELAKTLKSSDKKLETEKTSEVKNDELASATTEKPIDSVSTENTKQIEPKEITVPSEPVVPNESKPMDTVLPEKKDSILLQAMRQNASSDDSKLNKYYKELKESLSEKTKETKNVFQPPFKSSQNRGALIESFSDDNKIENKTQNQETNLPLGGEPIKYNHLIKIQETGNKQKESALNDEKFVDLGDL